MGQFDPFRREDLVRGMMKHHARPVVWYVAAGYKLPAGIEAYLLHYATEMRRRGFEPRIVVFERFPKVKHRYLAALEERGIPIESLFEDVWWWAVMLTAATFLPWWGWKVLGGSQKTEDGGRRTEDGGRVSEDKLTDNHQPSTIPVPPTTLFSWWLKRLAVRRLRRMIDREQPDLIHVKGRIVAEAWPLLPGERTVYQHALSGTVDPSWTAGEVRAFGVFANRIARVLAPGAGVARTLAREYGIDRPIDAVFTMAPDETEDRGRKTEDGGRWTVDGGGKNSLRFGIVCRFTEQKGISFILDALRQYRDRHGDVCFLFAGQGELEDTILRYAQEHGLDHVQVAPVPNLAAVMDRIDVFVHPGLDDAMPVSIVEALMFGKPCVGTRVGGVPDLIRDGVEGLLIDPGSSGQIVAAMERFAALSADEWAGFQARARARYETMCRPEVVGAVVAGIYRQVMSGCSDCRNPP